MNDDQRASDILLRKLQDEVNHWEMQMLASPGDKVFERRWKAAIQERDNMLNAKTRAGTA